MPEHRLDSTCSTITVVTRFAPAQGVTVSGDSEYVEVVYAGVLGPSALLIYRRLVRMLGRSPGRICISVDDMATAFGLRQANALRSLERLIDFRFAELSGGELVVRMAVPVASPRLLSRLSPSVREYHAEMLRRVAKVG